MGTKIVESTKPLGLKSVDRSGFFGFDVYGRQHSTLTEEEEEGFLITKSMDRFLDKQNAESIRHTMQAQQDIFKQQVRELHRVYNTQKMMMEQLKDRSQYRAINNKDLTGSRERTGSCSGIDLERAGKTTTGHIEESELELTLSIGMSSSSTTNTNTNTTTTNKDMDLSSTTSFRSSSDNCNNQSNNKDNSNNSGPTTPMSSSSTTSLDREKKRPHWLFQGLSINPTS